MATDLQSESEQFNFQTADPLRNIDKVDSEEVFTEENKLDLKDSLHLTNTLEGSTSNQTHSDLVSSKSRSDLSQVPFVVKVKEEQKDDTDKFLISHLREELKFSADQLKIQTEKLRKQLCDSDLPGTLDSVSGRLSGLGKHDLLRQEIDPDLQTYRSQNVSSTSLSLTPSVVQDETYSTVVLPTDESALNRQSGSSISSQESTDTEHVFDDSGISVDVPSDLSNKQPVVSLGERIAITQDGRMYTIPPLGEEGINNLGETTGIKKTKKTSRSRKSDESAVAIQPARRKREASLNAAARVNILYEREAPAPKSPKKTTPSPVRRKSSTSSTCSNDKVGLKKACRNLDQVSSAEKTGKSYKHSKGSIEKKKVKNVKQTNKNSEKQSSNKSPRKKDANLQAKKKLVLSKYKHIKVKNINVKNLGKTFKEMNLKTGKPSVKLKNKMDKEKKESLKKRKVKEMSPSDAKHKKERTNTQRAARTHFTSFTRKRRSSGVQCIGCCQKNICNTTSSSYWKSSDCTVESGGSEQQSDESAHVIDMSSPFPSVASHVTLVESPPYMNTVIPHQTLPTCPRCAQPGIISTHPCQSYTLGGIGSLGSVQVMPYPQHFGGSYRLPYQSSQTLAHHGCSACYGASGVYFPPTNTSMPHTPLGHDLSHQPVGHDACHIPSPAATYHKKDCEERRTDELIDVGNTDDLQPSDSVTISFKKSEKKKQKKGGLQVKKIAQSPKSVKLTSKAIEKVKMKKPENKAQKIKAEKLKLLKLEKAKVEKSKKLKQQLKQNKEKKVEKGEKSKTKNVLKVKFLKPIHRKSSYDGKSNTPVVTKQKSRRLSSGSQSLDKNKYIASSKTASKLTDKLEKSKGKDTAEKQKKKVKKKEVVNKSKINRSISRHGWQFDGEPEKKKFQSLYFGTSVNANCYQSIHHVDGDSISVRECVLLRSGPKKTDIPYVAKVTSIWEEPNGGDVMMSLLWYYQPEHTEAGREPYHADNELFASKHKDENSVACIDDKAYVLTFAEYCRYRAEQRRLECGMSPRPSVVPTPEEEYPRAGKLPPPDADPNSVFLCRQVYDFKLKRILKNPS